MGRGDNRSTRKMRQKKSQRKKKALELRKINQTKDTQR